MKIKKLLVAAFLALALVCSAGCTVDSVGVGLDAPVVYPAYTYDYGYGYPYYGYGYRYGHLYRHHYYRGYNHPYYRGGNYHRH